MPYFFDATVSLNSALNTGIQRVVRAIAQEAKSEELKVVVAKESLEPLTFLSMDPSSLANFLNFKGQSQRKSISSILQVALFFRPLLVQFYRFRFFRILKDEIRNRIVGFDHIDFAEFHEGIVQITPKDTYITFDAFWNSHSDFERLVEVSKLGSRVVILVHDIFPLTHPEWFERNNILNFHNYFLSGVERANLLLFSSRASMRTFEIIFPNNRTPKELIPFGSDKLLDFSDNNSGALVPGQETKQILMIGTLEPRKNYLEVLKWYQVTKLDLKLVIIGRYGWKSAKVLRKIRELRLRGYRVEWHSSLTDPEVTKFLSSASLALCASLDEGFGLPLREFTAYGLPVVASDIEVFREISTPNIRYFTLGDRASLEKAINECLSMTRYQMQDTLPTWSDSYSALLRILDATEI